MSNEVLAFAAANGELRYQRDLRDALLCDGIVLSPQRVVFHSLRKRTVTLQCLDLPTGRLAWESALVVQASSLPLVWQAPSLPNNGAGKVPAPQGPDQVRLEGLRLPPLAWRGSLLHLDLGRHCLWPVRAEDGTMGGPFDVSGAQGAKLGGDISSWGVTGDTLYLVDKTGCVTLISLSKQ